MHKPIPADSLSQRETYRLLTTCLVPRPIAWVSTLNQQGEVNLAPFSFYTMLSTDPALIGLSISRVKGRDKDTLVNVQANGELVVNFVTPELLDQMHASSASYPAEVGEARALGVDLVASEAVGVPGVAKSPIRLECRLDQIMSFGSVESRLVIARVLCFNILEDCMVAGKLESTRLTPVARLGGPWYAELGQRIHKLPPAALDTGAPWRPAST